MTLNKKGLEMFEIWRKNYHIENDKLGGNSAEGDFIEGWCIIDNDDYIKNITDECGLLIYAYDDNALFQVLDWIDEYGPAIGDHFNFTYTDVARELLKYFVKIDFTDDAEKMRDFHHLTRAEFLESYSYLTDAEYDATAAAVGYTGK